VSDAPVVYLVYIAVDAGREAEWLRWMCDQHVPDVIATGSFDSATILRDPASDSPHRVAFRIAYTAASQAALTEYQRAHAPALQAEHTARYEGCFEARREILPVVHSIRQGRPGR